MFVKTLGARISAVLAGLCLLAVAWLVFALTATNGDLLTTDDSAVITAARTGLESALGYDYRHLDEGLDRATSEMTDEFADEFQRTFEKTAGTLATKNKAVVEVTVQGAGIVRNTGAEAVVLTYVDQVRTGGSGKQPQLVQSRVAVELSKEDGRWQIADIRPF